MLTKKNFFLLKITNFRSLSDKNKLKVIAMCDVDQRKINLGKYEIYDEIQHKIITRIPIISYK